MSTGTVRIRQAILVLMLVAGMLTCLPAGAGEPYLRRWSTETATPALRLNDLDGREWDIGNLRGKVVVLNFWASWCAPCIDEIPVLDELAGDAALAGQVVILGVNFKESATTIRRFSNDHALRYPVLLDKSGEHFKKWATGVLPTTVLIDRNGRPRWRIVGELNRSDGSLREAIGRMLAEPGRGKTAGAK